MKTLLVILTSIFLLTGCDEDQAYKQKEVEMFNIEALRTQQKVADLPDGSGLYRIEYKTKGGYLHEAIYVGYPKPLEPKVIKYKPTDVSINGKTAFILEE